MQEDKFRFESFFSKLNKNYNVGFAKGPIVFVQDLNEFKVCVCEWLKAKGFLN